MGDLFRSRRRKTWTKAEDYTPTQWAKVIPAHQWRGEPKPAGRLMRFWRAARWWVALVLLAGVWVLWRDAVAWRAPAFLEGRPLRINGHFEMCPAGTRPLCVIDGDT